MLAGVGAVKAAHEKSVLKEGNKKNFPLTHLRTCLSPDRKPAKPRPRVGQNIGLQPQVFCLVSLCAASIRSFTESILK